MGLEEIVARFDIRGTAGSVVPYGSGYIHDTYLVNNTTEGFPAYLLQRINDRIFPDVEGMMANIRMVCEELAARLEQAQVTNKTFRPLRLILTREGSAFAWHNGSYWRLYHFYDDLVSYDQLPDLHHIYECGRGYGRFLATLTKLDPDKLTATIPRFHDLRYRLAQLEAAPGGDPGSEESACMDYVRVVAPGLLKEADRPVPERITHNDTKCNNILFDDYGHAVCVVDLDTVMPGKVWHDVGDALRTLITRAAEDEEDIAKVKIDPDRYEKFLEGYLEMTHHLLRQEELASLPLSAAGMAFIMGVRFLTDHLNGDSYYKTEYRGHNLVRARNQLALTAEVIRQREMLTEKLKRIVRGLREK